MVGEKNKLQLDRNTTEKCKDRLIYREEKEDGQELNAEIGFLGTLLAAKFPAIKDV